MRNPMTFPAERSTIRECMSAIHAGGANIALALDKRGNLVGTVTDGDLRRAILGGASLDDQVSRFIKTNPFVVGPEESRSSALDLMYARGISQIPIVTPEGKVVGIHFLNELLGSVERGNMAVLLAGGRGTRLSPLTDSVPKPMLRVAGRPILERLIDHLVGHGFRRIVLAVGYLSHKVEEHFGNGERFGCEILYLREDANSPRGTAGPLAYLTDVSTSIEEDVLVVNGDLLSQFDASSLLTFHEKSDSLLTIGVVSYAHEVPYGVVEVDPGHRVTSIVEKPVVHRSVSAGIYALSPSLISRIPRHQMIMMTDVIERCLNAGEKVSAWQCHGDWLDVGRPIDLSRAKGSL